MGILMKQIYRMTISTVIWTLIINVTRVNGDNDNDDDYSGTFTLSWLIVLIGVGVLACAIVGMMNECLGDCIEMARRIELIESRPTNTSRTVRREAPATQVPTISQTVV